MKYLYTLLLTLCILMSTSTLTQAQRKCRAFDPIIFEQLFQDFGESRVFTGVGPDSELLYITLNPKTGTFTFLVTDGKMMCETGDGTGGEVHKPRAPGFKES